MIERYFEKVERVISHFANIRSFTLSKNVYDERQGFIHGIIVFWDDSRLDFAEVKDAKIKPKIKYRYHYMDKNNNLLFRYDNAKHHQYIKTYPHHKHVKNQIAESVELDLFDVLMEIEKMGRNNIA